MRTFRYLTLSLFILGIAGGASAQATRTWVSGVGDDVNPCSRTAPCKTFAGAISKTAAKGEISVLDPGGFGAVTITKSITINGDGTLAGILSSLTNGVIVNDGSTGTPNTIEVTLRNLSINGAGNGLNGVRFLAGKRLTIQNCLIQNLDPTANHVGVDVVTNAANVLLEIYDTEIVGTGGLGVQIAPAGGNVLIAIDGLHQSRSFTNSGLVANGNVKGVISNSDFSHNASGAGVAFGGTAEVLLDHVRATDNNVGVQNFAGTPTTRLKDSVFIGNTLNGALNSAGTMTGFQSNVITNPSGVIGSSAPTH